jgi:hypothetical protein
LTESLGAALLPDMIERLKRHFKDAKFARMSDGTLCLIRDLGLVKGGKGMKHHETLVMLNLRGMLAFMRQSRPKDDWTNLPSNANLPTGF